MKKEVLHVCANNVARSQWAAAYWNQLLPGEAASAGTIVDDDGGLVKDWVGDPDNIIRAAEEDGLAIAEQRRTLLTREVLELYGLVIVWAQPGARPNWLKEGGNVIIRTVMDPVNMSLEDTRKLRDQVKEKTLRIIGWQKSSS